MGLLVIIAGLIAVPILMADSIQSSLNVTKRNALLGAAAFMDPYRDVFQFIEDIVLIRVSYSLATGHKKNTNQLMHVGIVAAFCTGIVAAVIGTILGVIPAVLSTLTNPGAVNNEAMYPDCELVTSYDSSIVMPYWIIQMCGMPGQLLGLVLSGFIFGAHQWLVGGWIIGFSMVSSFSSVNTRYVLFIFTHKLLSPESSSLLLYGTAGENRVSLYWVLQKPQQLGSSHS